VHEAEKNGIDPLFLAAVIYQESRFNARARSRTGVRGLMMITQATAEDLDVADRLDPEQSIRGGAAYLRELWERLEPLGLEPWDRWFLALAAYNQGINHLRDAVELSRRMGGSGETWRDVKKVFPLLAWQKYYSQAKYGYTRGYEAVTYVDSIRYFYYILHGFVVLGRPEAEHLGPLLGAAPDGWPVP
jgi:membrane-bound lytic murein transglycosylase F